jgi:hypothetical protein
MKSSIKSGEERALQVWIADRLANSLPPFIFCNDQVGHAVNGRASRAGSVQLVANPEVTQMREALLAVERLDC